MVFLVSCWLSRNILLPLGTTKAYCLLLCVKLNSQCNLDSVWMRSPVAFGDACCGNWLSWEVGNPSMRSRTLLMQDSLLPGWVGVISCSVQHRPFPWRRWGRYYPQFPLFCTWINFISINKKEMLACITVKWGKKCVCFIYCRLSISILLWKWSSRVA